MKLCFVGSLASVHLQRWVRYFAEREHEVHVLNWDAPVGDANIGPATVHQVQRLGRALSLRGLASAALALLPTLYRYRRLIRRLDPDVTHVHYINDAALVTWIAAPDCLVLTAWGSDVLINPERSCLQRWVVKRAIAGARRITCDADHVATKLGRLGARRDQIEIVFFGTDVAHFSPATGGRAQDPDRPVIVSLRRFEPVYDVGTLIEAVPIVLARIPGARFVLAGSGSETASLRERARRLCVADAVRFVGEMPLHGLPAFLNDADVYVSTALSDGGLAASTAEAMSCGLPVVITDVGNNREWVDDGVAGYVVPCSDAGALAARICDLVSDPARARAMGTAGRQVIVSRNNWADQMARVGDMYARLTNRISARGRPGDLSAASGTRTF